jgi:glucokinase
MGVRGGIDLGGTKIQAVVLNGRGTVVADARRQTPTSGGPPAITAEMAGALADAAADAGVEMSSLSSVGVGSPGVIDSAAGTVASARNLDDWIEPFPLASELSKAVGGAPVSIGNDVSVATEAEFRLGAGKPYKSLLGVFWGTGVGGGIVIGGKLWVGRGAAAEIGHIVVKKDGAQCPCGRSGCLEAYAGRGSMEAKARREVEHGRTTVLFKLMERKGRTRLSSGVWAKAVEEGDELAIELIDRAISYLGAGIGSAVNLIDPEAVVIGGGMGVRFGETYLDRIRDATMPHVFADERPPEIMVAALGDLGGATGAALLSPARPARQAARRSAGAGGGAPRGRARR